MLSLLLPSLLVMFVFLFQAEDGIRDLTVTGVQTCALPICARLARGDARERRHHGVPHDRKYIRPMTESPVRRHHWIVRLTHWVTVVTLAGLIKIGRASCRERV